MRLRQSLWIGSNVDREPNHISIGHAVARSARQWPDAEAVVFACQPDIDETRWTFAELDELSNRLAAAILAQGFLAGERVAIFGANHPHWILLEYALAKAGLIIVAVNPLYRQAELTFALQSSQAVCVFYAETVSGESVRPMMQAVVDELSFVRRIFSFSEDIAGLLENAPVSYKLPEIGPEQPFMIQYTSGTTGVPKAAWLPHGGISMIAARSYERWQFGAGDRVCHGFPLFHVGGSGNSTPGSLIVGATTLPIHRFRAEEALDILEQEHCTGFIGVPSMMSAMIETGGLSQRRLSALRRMVVGGTPVAPAALKYFEDAFGVEMLNGYGQTETCGVCASVAPGDSAARKTQTSGIALPGVSLKVVDGEGRVVPCGKAGELCANGFGKMIGYGDAKANRAAFDDEEWLRTGDLATMDGDGYISIVGRLKEMIIRGGENLYPLEIESYLIEHPDVAEAAVIGLPDKKYGEEVCAVLRASRSPHASPEALRAWCAGRVSRWKVPKYIAFVDDLPMTVSGKVKKHELASLMQDHFLNAFPQQ